MTSGRKAQTRIRFNGFLVKTQGSVLGETKKLDQPAQLEAAQQQPGSPCLRRQQNRDDVMLRRSTASLHTPLHLPDKVPEAAAGLAKADPHPQ